jgi:hypothetical protein
VTTWLTAAGVLLAALSHLSVSRHSPPPGWGWVYASYELIVPGALLVALAVPSAREVAVAVAAAVAGTVGGASVVMAGVVRSALLEQRDEAQLGRVLSRSARWSTDLDGPERELRRRVERSAHQGEA